MKTIRYICSGKIRTPTKSEFRNMNINILKINGKNLFEQYAEQLDERQQKQMNFILARIDYIGHATIDLDRRIFEKIYEEKGGLPIGCVFKEKDVMVYCLYSFNAIDIVMGGWKRDHTTNTRLLLEIHSETRNGNSIIERNTVNLKTMRL